MTMAGCREVGLDEPKKTKQLIVYVEIDRCAADAIQAVTGCKLGKRTLKHVDYGKMAATFVNIATGRAVRVAAKETAREEAWRHAPGAPTTRPPNSRSTRSCLKGSYWPYDRSPSASQPGTCLDLLPAGSSAWPAARASTMAARCIAGAGCSAGPALVGATTRGFRV